MKSLTLCQEDLFRYTYSNNLDANRLNWGYQPILREDLFDSVEQKAIKNFVEKWTSAIDEAILKGVSEDMAYSKPTSTTATAKYNTRPNKEDYEIKDFEIIVPNKVVKVNFTDGTFEKMVCHEDDMFDLKWCMFVAIAKKLYKNRYTCDGIEYKARELTYLKSTVKMVDKVMKDYNKKIKEEEKAKRIEEAKKSAKENKKRKHAKYIKRRDVKRQKERDEEMRQKFEYDVAVHVEAAKRIKHEELVQACFDNKHK